MDGFKGFDDSIVIHATKISLDLSDVFGDQSIDIDLAPASFCRSFKIGSFKIGSFLAVEESEPIDEDHEQLFEDVETGILRGFIG